MDFVGVVLTAVVDHQMIGIVAIVGEGNLIEYDCGPEFLESYEQKVVVTEVVEEPDLIVNC